MVRIWWWLVRFGFTLLYNPLAWSYDLVSNLVSLGQWRHWQRVGVSRMAGEPTLELAHGPGHMLVELGRVGRGVVGLDLSPYMGRLARRRLSQQGLHVPLVRARAQDLPFASSAFASVLSTFPTEFIVDPATLSEVHRVLRPGGRLVFIPEARLKAGPASPRILVSVIEGLYAVTGQRGPWPAGIEDRLSQAGFQVQIETEPLPTSEVRIILAEKPKERGA